MIVGGIMQERDELFSGIVMFINVTPIISTGKGSASCLVGFSVLTALVERE